MTPVCAYVRNPAVIRVVRAFVRLLSGRPFMLDEDNVVVLFRFGLCRFPFLRLTIEGIPLWNRLKRIGILIRRCLRACRWRWVLHSRRVEGSARNSAALVDVGRGRRARAHFGRWICRTASTTVAARRAKSRRITAVAWLAPRAVACGFRCRRRRCLPICIARIASSSLLLLRLLLLSAVWTFHLPRQGQ